MRRHYAHALTQNGRAATEVATPPVVADQGPIRHGDERNSTLVLIRVQPSETARRGRGLVRIFTDLVERPIPAVATCDHCSRMYNVSVDLRDQNNPVVLHLQSNCRRCGHPMDDYQTVRDLIGTARLYAETAHLINQFEPDGAA